MPSSKKIVGLILIMYLGIVAFQIVTDWKTIRIQNELDNLDISNRVDKTEDANTNDVFRNTFCSDDGSQDFIEIYYIPYPEDQVFTSLKSIFPQYNNTCSGSIYEPENPIFSYNSIGIIETGTIIHFDHWEDGLENNLASPTQATTEIWGDGNNANGIPPGYTTDFLVAGSIIILESQVNTFTRQSIIDFDGGDKIGAKQNLIITRFAWANGTDTFLAGALEVYPTVSWGSNFIIPIGENENVNDMFQYVGAVVMAKDDNTIVRVDKDGDGVFELILILNEGESYLQNGNIDAGGRISSSLPVQVHLITGDICATYETRWFTLSPSEQWSSSYYTPVSTMNNGTTQASDFNRPTYIHFYNPNTSAITIYWETSMGNQAPFIIPAESTSYLEMPEGTGAHFYSSGNSPFYAIATIDSDEGGNKRTDWGFVLLPERQLSAQITSVGYAPGQDPTKSGTENSAPIWLTAGYPVGSSSTGSITICIDLDGDGGSLADVNGTTYDYSIVLNALEQAKIYDPDRDQTGMRIWVCDGSDAIIAGAWGQDPTSIVTEALAIDLGVSLRNGIPFTATKCVDLITDFNGNGDIDECDEIMYTITVTNTGALPILPNNMSVIDTLPEGITYIQNTTTYNNGSSTTLGDETGTASPFLLDENGYIITDAIDPDQTITFTFNASINDLAETTLITNIALVSDGNQTLQPQVTFEAKDLLDLIPINLPPDLDLGCNDPIPVAPIQDTCLSAVTNPCALPVVFNETSTQTSPTDNNYIITRTWTLTDDCGNVSVHTQLITKSCEICDNNIDDDGDGLIDDFDPECSCSESSINDRCDGLYYYYIPPVWQPTGDNYSQPSYLYITTTSYQANVNISTPDNSVNQDFYLESTSPILINISGFILQTDTENTVHDTKGLILTSNQPIDIIHRVDAPSNRFAVSAKGEDALGKVFRAGSQTKVCGAPDSSKGENHFVSVMATEDNTTVIFDFPQPMQGITNPHSITLNAGQTYLVRDPDNNTTVSGALITADKAIAVISGSQHSPSCNFTGNDAGIDQLVPVCNIGDQYVMVRGRGSDDQNYAIVVAVENNTEVFLNGSTIPIATINAGDYHQFDITGNLGDIHSLRSSKPVYLYTMAGLTSFGADMGMALSAPVGVCKGDNHVEFLKAIYAEEHIAYVIISNDGLASLRLNGNSYITYGSPVPVPGLAGYSVVIFDHLDILNYNILTSDVYFHAAVMTGSFLSNGTHTYLTSFESNIDIYDPETNLMTESYFVDTLCSGTSLEHCIYTVSCSDNTYISNIEFETNTQSEANITSDLCFEYTAGEGFTGIEQITVTIQNDYGIEEKVCLEFYICDDSPSFSGIPEDVTVYCNDIPPIPDPVINYGCGSGEEFEYEEYVEEICRDQNYKITRTWRIMDVCGNLIIETQTVTVIDNLDPLIINIPADVTVDCNNIPDVPTLIGTDNCDNIVDITYRDTTIAGNCIDTYTLIRTWTAADDCDNTDEGFQTITVQNCDPDLTTTIDPGSSVCANETVILTANFSGTYDIVYQWQYSPAGNNWVDIVGATDSIYTIPQPTNDDLGWYQCIVATNIAGLTTACSITSNTVHLQNIIVSPDLVVLDIEICEGDSYPFGGEIYTEEGIYADTISTVQQCDSIVELHLVVHPSYDDQISGVICAGDIFSVGGTDYTESGTYTDHLTTVNGCDSIITTELIVIPAFLSTLEVDICEGDSLMIGSTYQSETGIYVDKYTATTGCDSTYIIELNVLPPELTLLDYQLCEGDSILLGGAFQNSSGIYEDTLQSYLGCDSILIHQLSVLPSVNEIIDIEICEGDSIFVQGTYQHDQGLYTDTLTSVTGCDSILITNLEVISFITENYTEAICAGDSILIGNNYQTVPGIYIDTYTGYLGCDSIVITDLNILPIHSTPLDVEICQGDSIQIGEDYQTLGGIYADTLQNQFGCDSIIFTNLSILPSHLYNVQEQICNGSSIFLGGANQTTAGTYTDNFINQFGCDSIVITELDILLNTSSTANLNICQGDSIFVGGAYQTVAGNYPDTLVNASGCDSIIITTLSILPSYLQEQEYSICDGDSLFINGAYQSTSGTYIESLSTEAGCDSILIIELTLIPILTNTIELDICEGDSIYLANEYQTTSGFYTDTLTNIDGCDSILITQLTVIESINTLIDISLCPGDSTLVNGIYETEPGVYSDTLQAALGCDSIVVTNLTIERIFNNELVEICEGDSTYLENDYQTNPGIYLDTLTSANGCDSIIITDLIILPSSTTNQSLSICFGDSILIDGVYQNTSGTYTEVYQNQFNCDSTIFTELTVFAPDISTFTVAICQGDSVQIGDQYESIQGVYTDTLSNQNGCDSISITTLNVHPTFITNEDISICEGDGFYIDGTYQTVGGIYISELQSSFACDSTVITNLILLPTYNESVTVELCSGDSVLIGNNYETNPGIYTETLTTVDDCDSTIVTKIILIPINIVNDQLQICEGDSVLLAGTYQTTSGVYTDTLMSSANCDSIVITQLSVIESFNIVNEESICLGDSIFLAGSYQDTDGIYIDTLQSSQGCDSIITTTLSVFSIFSDDQISICEGESVIIGGAEQDTPGIYVDTLTSANGCDSVVFTELEILPIHTVNLSESICQGQSIFIGGANQTTAGLYVDTYENQYGCDSFVITTLFIIPSDIDNKVINLCQGDSIFAGGDYQTTAGTYTDYLQNQIGCDSIITTLVTITPTYYDSISLSICEGESILIGSEYENTVGTYTYTYTTEYGCDSTVVTELQVVPEHSSSTTYNICIGDSLLINGVYESQPGIYTEVLTSSTGCDSVLMTELLVHSPDLEFINVRICEGDSLLINNVYQSKTGIYNDTLTTTFGCDSIVVTQLLVIETYTIIDDVNICLGDSILLEGEYQTETGIYIDSLLSTTGCDSLIVTNLSVNTFTGNTIVEICEGENIFIGGAFQDEAGIYVDTLISESGCDSILYSEVILLPIDIEHAEAEICTGDSIYLSGAYQYSSGIYMDIFQNQVGCDSIVSTFLNVLPNSTDIVDIEICEGESANIGGGIQTTTGTYADTLQSANGCDSIIISRLTVLPIYDIVNEVSICDGDSILVGINYEYTAGSYTNVWTSTFNCDSTITTIVSVLPSYEENQTITICEGESVFLGGANQTTSGIYTDAFLTAERCDSTIITQLNVVPLFVDTLSLGICEGESITIGGSQESTAGYYTNTFQNINGCDSTVVTELILWPNFYETEELIVCDDDSLFINGVYQTESGIYTQTYSTVNGCDSIVETILTVLPYIVTDEPVQICLGDSIFVGGDYQNIDGIFYDTLTNVIGCDSIVITDLTVVNSFHDTIPTSICIGDSIFAGGAYQTISGTYTDFYITLNGCDSTITTILDVSPHFTETANQTICEGDSILIGGVYQTITGTYSDTIVNVTDTLQTTSGCDSIVYTELTVLKSFIANEIFSICEGDSILLGGNYQHQSGIYIDSLQTVSGCDSILISQLFTFPVFNDTTYHTICEGDSHFADGANQTNSGTYIDSWTSANNCDSTLVTILTVLQPTTTNIVEMICSSDSILLGGSYQNSPGIYSDTLSNYIGCDSIINTSLSILPEHEQIVNLDVCEGSIIFAGGAYQTTSGTYTDTYTNIFGCDSLKITNLLVSPTYEEEVDLSICADESIFIGGANQTSSGTYIDNFFTEEGCDSIIITNLTVLDVYYENKTIEICAGDSISLGGAFQNVSGVYFDTLQSNNFCDSLIITDLIILPIAFEHIELTICEGDSILLGNEYQTEATVYADTLTSGNSCDSIILTTLSVIPNITEVYELVICAGDSILAGGAYQSETGIFLDTLPSYNGCDSIILTDLIVLPMIITDENITICLGDSILLAGDYQTSSGIYADSLVGIVGCDSIVYTTLNVIPSPDINMNVEICAGETFDIGSNSYTNDGIYSDTLVSFNGCDSILTVELTVLTVHTLDVIATICEGDDYIIGDHGYGTPGVYVDTLISSIGCDSIITLYLDILPVYETVLDETICEGESFSFGGGTYSTNGTHIQEWFATNSCDSTVILNLTVIPPAIGTSVESICQGDSLFVGGAYQTISGIYSDTLNAFNGCDSIDQVELIVLPSSFEIQDIIICEGESVFLEGINQTESGLYFDQFTAHNGCDSSVYTNLIVVPNYTTVSDAQICANDSIFIGGDYQNSSGVYIDTLLTSGGCDSIIITDLIVLESLNSFIDLAICEGESIFVGGSIQTSAGIFVDSLTASGGCDSIVYSSLTVHPNPKNNIIVEICDGDAFVVGNNSYTTSGQYLDTLTTVHGCDSIIQVNLSVLPLASASITATICQGESYFIGSNVYTSSGIYEEVFIAANGCDSILTLDLNVLPAQSLVLNREICEGESISIGNEIYTDTGTYADTLIAVNGCDSIITLNLNVLPIGIANIDLILCEGDGTFAGGAYQTTTGIYYDTLATTAACDSVFITTLTILPNSSTNQEFSLCQGDSILVAGNYISEAGLYIDTLNNHIGCDSIIFTTLNTTAIVSTSFEAQICSGDSININGTHYTEPGIYIDTLLATNGCDSLVVTDLSVIPALASFEETTICEGDSVLIGGVYQSTSNLYTDTLTAAGGCDSILFHTLVVIPSSSSFLQAVICEGESYEVDGTVYNTTGSYINTLTSENGCDSLVNLDLTVRPAARNTIDADICEGETFIIGGSIYTTTGNYQDTLTAVSGCDSIISLNLQVLTAFDIFLTETICEGEGFVFGNEIYTTSGTYTDFYTTASGCDSLITLTLNILPLSTSNTDLTICAGESILIGSTYETVGGIYIDTLTNANNCDSIAITQLTVLDIILTHNEQTICEGDSILLSGTYQNTDGLYADTLMAANGCDSIIITNLDIVPNTIAFNSITICENDSIYIAGAYQNEVGIYYDTLTNYIGCDSIIVTDLNITTTLIDTTNLAICIGDSIFVAGAFESTPGIYIESFTSTSGCDSLVYNRLTVNPVQLTALEEEICYGNAVEVAGNSYNETGFYIDTLTTTVGCDSIITLNLTVWPQSTTQRNVTICSNETYNFGNNILTTTGIYLDTLADFRGCDSILQLDLNILPLLDTMLTASICPGDSYEIGNSVYEESGLFSDTLIASTGCDSIVTLDLNVWPEIPFTIFREGLCPGDTAFFAGTYFTETGTYFDTLNAITGCDSILVLDLTIYPITEASIADTICEGSLYEIGTSVYSEAGIYIDTITNYYGCDSIVTLDLTVLPLERVDLVESICDGDTLIVGTSAYTTEGMYSDTLVAFNGCDSIITLDLTILNVPQTHLSEAICMGSDFIVGDSVYTEPGNYETILTAANGCDSIITLNLAFIPPILPTNLEVAICEGEFFVVGDSIYTETGIYTDTLVATNTCDSIVILDLEVIPQIGTTLDEFICWNDAYTFGDSIYTNDGTYYDTLTSYTTCDSIVTLNLTVLTEFITVIDTAICFGEVFSVADTSYMYSGTYTHILSSYTGCDSTVTLNLGVLPIPAESLDVTICIGDTYAVGSTEYDTPGTYVDTLIAYTGCDSIVTLHLDILSTLYTSIQLDICEGESVFIDGGFQSETGTYVDSLAANTGCDSIVVTNLIVHPEYEQYLEYTICEGDSILIAGNYVTESGIFYDSLQTNTGCDSLVITELLVEEQVELFASDAEICEGDAVQLEVSGGYNYHWSPAEGLSCIDCPNPMASPSFTTTYTITSDNCLGTIESIEVTVFVNNMPWVDAGEDQSVILGDIIDLEATGGGSSLLTFDWGTPDSLICENCKETTAVITENSIFFVTVTDAYGCSAIDELQVVMNDECEYGELDIPNAITPNGDGFNDDFNIKFEGFAELTLLRIYNRWGELVFETRDMNKKWDATFRGIPVNPGVYVYYLEGICLNKQSFLEKGNVTVLK